MVSTYGRGEYCYKSNLFRTNAKGALKRRLLPFRLMDVRGDFKTEEERFLALEHES